MAVNEDNNVKEYLLSLDDLGQPDVVDMSVIKSGVMNSAAILLIKLIIMRKGTIPDIPDLGIDIKGRYRFSFDSELTMLENDIEDQIALYIPEFLPVSVSCSVLSDSPSDIIIAISINGTIYQLVYNTANSTLEYLTE
jgi:hypothetical protein